MDKLSFFLTCLRNGHIANRAMVKVRAHSFTHGVLDALLRRNLINAYRYSLDGYFFEVYLRYFSLFNPFANVQQFTRPGHRLFLSKLKLDKRRKKYAGRLLLIKVGYKFYWIDEIIFQNLGGELYLEICF